MWYHESAIEIDRHGCVSIVSYYNNPGEWQLQTFTFTVPDDSAYEYIECDFIVYAMNDATPPIVYLRKPMLEEADSYAG